MLGDDIKATFRSKSQSEKSAVPRHTYRKEREEKSIFYGLFEFRSLPHASTWNQNLQTRSECERAIEDEKMPGEKRLNAIVGREATLDETIVKERKQPSAIKSPITIAVYR